MGVSYRMESFRINVMDNFILKHLQFGLQFLHSYNRQSVEYCIVISLVQLLGFENSILKFA